MKSSVASKNNLLRTIFPIKVSCFFMLSMVFAAVAFAQQPATNSGGLKMFYEKTYVVTDRDYYAAGDDIWFKAFLVNAKSNFLIGFSKNLYVELISPDAQLVMRNVVRMDDGLGKGDFKLADSLPSGSYKIRAYTNWMKNFGANFIFEKDIQIVNVRSTAKGSASTASVKPIKPAVKQSEKAVYKIQFLPEGGDLLEGVSSIVAFKAEDINGSFANVNGYILASTGDTAAKFASSYLGMGSFTFVPQPGVTYKALVQYNSGSWMDAEMLTPYTTGYTLSIKNEPTNNNLIVQISTNAATQAAHPTSDMVVIGRHTKNAYFKEKVQVKEGKATVNIPKNNFPNGIASITLYDERNRPNCERLVYIQNNDQSVNLSIATNQQTYQPKDKVTVTVTATDANQKPVVANLTLAVVDGNLVKTPTSNIYSFLQLESEIKGKIDNPAAYFDTANAKRDIQLDLLLRAQGWRSFLWNKLADTTIRISALPEPGITLSGKVHHTFTNKGLANMNVSLMAAGAKGDKLYMTKTDSVGRYYLDGLVLYGNQTIRLSSKDMKAQKGGIIQLDTLFDNKLPVYASNIIAIDTAAFLKKFRAEAAKRYTITHVGAIDKNALEDVVVTTKSAKVSTNADGYADQSFGYPVYNFNITNQDKEYKNLENYLIHNIPGAIADPENEGINFIANGKAVRPRFRVDNREDVFNRLDYYTISIEQVISVKVEHLLRNTGAGVQDVFWIHLMLKPGAFNNDLSILNTEVTGYYEARAFYAPSYQFTKESSKADLRTTIFWEPDVVTDENGKAEISFYNPDPKTVVRVTVQGIASKNVPVAAATKYEVK